jgi:hypothetical protein
MLIGCHPVRRYMGVNDVFGVPVSLEELETNRVSPLSKGSLQLLQLFLDITTDEQTQAKTVSLKDGWEYDKKQADSQLAQCADMIAGPSHIYFRVELQMHVLVRCVASRPPCPAAPLQLPVLCALELRVCLCHPRRDSHTST